MKRYVKVVIRPHKIKRYPLKAKEISFILPWRNAVQAVEMLMCYMGYGCTQYSIISCNEVDYKREKKNETY